ncbi:hypothetical protein TNIN_85291 [Trichonephila inaurata madagascariensis]|uniref:Uncharacterized protein n=1 Tax=Trichonephila inaurata madagascariensis TaxID=2747483 RepID=A0A8X7C6J7_9ARAC|nr:hypothetical protein TNIN_85291 [Trichonephila inaurata madagascariensis]
MSVHADRDVKRSFSDLGCMGVFDKAKFARLDRVCEECYQLFRESTSILLVGPIASRTTISSNALMPSCFEKTSKH